MKAAHAARRLADAGIRLRSQPGGIQAYRQGCPIVGAARRSLAELYEQIDMMLERQEAGARLPEMDEQTMRLYVWRGDKVLKNYTTGMVVIAAETEEEAWSKLRESDFGAWVKLQCGAFIPTYSGDDCKGDKDEQRTRNNIAYEELEEWEKDWKEPVKPQVYKISELPVLVLEGGE